MPERSIDGRTLVTDRTLEAVRAPIQNRSVGSLAEYSQPIISERGVSDARLPIQTRPTVGMLSEYSQAVTYDRTLADQRQPIIGRSYSERKTTVDSSEPVTQVSVAASQPLGQTVGNYYATGGGGGGIRSYDNPISVVPGGELSSNSNTGLILLVVAIAGGGAYWYYKKGGF